MVSTEFNDFVYLIFYYCIKYSLLTVAVLPGNTESVMGLRQTRIKIRR